MRRGRSAEGGARGAAARRHCGAIPNGEARRRSRRRRAPFGIEQPEPPRPRPRPAHPSCGEAGAPRTGRAAWRRCATPEQSRTPAGGRRAVARARRSGLLRRTTRARRRADHEDGATRRARRGRGARRRGAAPAASNPERRVARDALDGAARFGIAKRKPHPPAARAPRLHYGRAGAPVEVRSAAFRGAWRPQSRMARRVFARAAAARHSGLDSRNRPARGRAQHARHAAWQERRGRGARRGGAAPLRSNPERRPPARRAAPARAVRD